MGNKTAPTTDKPPEFVPGQGGVYIDGGEGDDRVIIGKSYPKTNKVWIKGGPGNDSVTMVDDDASAKALGKSLTIHGMGFDGTLVLVALPIVFATLGVIVWRALATPGPKRD